MSYIAKPGSMVAHIFKGSDVVQVGTIRSYTLKALCPARFPDAGRISYWPRTLQVGRRRRKVCEHCARMASRQALDLLRDAAGDRP